MKKIRPDTYLRAKKLRLSQMDTDEIDFSTRCGILILLVWYLLFLLGKFDDFQTTTVAQQTWELRKKRIRTNDFEVTNYEHTFAIYSKTYCTTAPSTICIQ